MRRAKGVFEKLGIDVVPAATDYQVPEPDPSILDWMPDAEALGLTTLGIKEYLGWWVYRIRVFGAGCADSGKVKIPDPPAAGRCPDGQ